MLTKKGSFAGPAAPTIVSVTNVGFRGKALIAWATANTAVGYQAGAALGLGFAVSPSQRCTTGAACQDAANPPNTARWGKDLALSVCDGSAVAQVEFELVDWTDDGFTLNFTTANAAYIIHYLVLGGTDLTDVFVGRSTPAASTPTSITGVPFRPDCVLTMAVFNGGAFPIATGGSQVGLGAFAAPAANAGASFFKDRDGTAPTLTGQWQKPVPSLSLQSSSDATQDEAAAAGWTMDAGGFTLPWTSRINNDHLIYLCLKGGSYWVGQDTQRTSTGIQSKTGIGFRPSGLLAFGVNAAANASPDFTQGNFVIGASDGINEGSSWLGDADAATPSDANTSTVTDKFLRHSSNPSTTLAECDAGFDVDGYTLGWTTADATAREFNVVAFGPPGGGRVVTTQVVRRILRSRRTNW